MSFIRETDLGKHRIGSLEQRLTTVRTAVQQAMGEGTIVLSTHDTYAIARATDGTIKRVSYQLQEGQTSDLAVTEAEDVPILAGLDLDRAAMVDLRETVQTMLDGTPIERTRVRDLAHMARKNRSYWVEEALAEAEVADSPWWNYYAPQAPIIREQLHGSIREIEGPVPRARFGKLAAGRLPEFESEMRACLKQIQGVAKGLFDALAPGMAYHKETVSAVHQSLRSEAQGIAEALAWVSQMDWAGKLPAVATAHDRLAARLRDGLVVRAHLDALTKEGTDDAD